MRTSNGIPRREPDTVIYCIIHTPHICRYQKSLKKSQKRAVPKQLHRYFTFHSHLKISTDYTEKFQHVEPTSSENWSEPGQSTSLMRSILQQCECNVGRDVSARVPRYSNLRCLCLRWKTHSGLWKVSKPNASITRSEMPYLGFEVKGRTGVTGAVGLRPSGELLANWASHLFVLYSLATRSRMPRVIRTCQGTALRYLRQHPLNFLVNDGKSIRQERATSNPEESLLSADCEQMLPFPASKRSQGITVMRLAWRWEDIPIKGFWLSLIHCL